MANSAPQGRVNSPIVIIIGGNLSVKSYQFQKESYQFQEESYQFQERISVFWVVFHVVWPH